MAIGNVLDQDDRRACGCYGNPCGDPLSGAGTGGPEMAPFLKPPA